MNIVSITGVYGSCTCMFELHEYVICAACRNSAKTRQWLHFYEVFFRVNNLANRLYTHYTSALCQYTDYKLHRTNSAPLVQLQSHV